MIKARQKNLRVFEISLEDSAEFQTYIEKNFPLLREYLLVLDGEVSPEIQTFLAAKNLCYMHKDGCMGSAFQIRSAQKSEENDQNDEKCTESEQKPLSNGTALVYNRPIRSGEEIMTDRDVVIFGRINSGAKVITGGNLQVYGDLDGIVQVDGEYMIIKKIGLGHAVFNGDILEKDQFDGSLRRITLHEGTIKVEEL